ncbi:MAG: DUF4260 domain-containing protein, partial [Chloroflexota bacterium]
MAVTIPTHDTASTDASSSNPAITMPRLMLHAEGLAVFVAATAAYGMSDVGPWWLYFVLLLVPDVFMLSYLLNIRAGAILYNAGHTLVVPLAFAGIALLTGWQIGVAIGLIWLAHIGMDRTAG